MKPTSKDIEGPFYRTGAPFQSMLYNAPGLRLLLQGRIVDTTGQPVTDAIVDLWQADKDGAYDHEGFNLRGKTTTEDDGRFTFVTNWPGCYDLGNNRWRPAHIHVKVVAPGFLPLTTQLYFANDPHNAVDPWYDATREIAPKQVDENDWVADYEIVIPREEVESLHIIAPKRGVTCPPDWKVQVAVVVGITSTTRSSNTMFVKATAAGLDALQKQLGQYLHIEPPIPHIPLSS